MYFNAVAVYSDSMQEPGVQLKAKGGGVTHMLISPEGTLLYAGSRKVSRLSSLNPRPCGLGMRLQCIMIIMTKLCHQILGVAGDTDGYCLFGH